jgi:formate hydrogenlyase subunit 4
MNIASGIVFQVLQSVLVVLIAPLMLGWVNQCRAWLQNKSGAGLWQPYRVLNKLFHKDAVLAHNASPLFRVTPYILFGCMWLAVGIVPVLATSLPFAPAADVIALVGLFALARVFVSLAGMDVGTSFGGIGSSREMMIASLAEPAMLLVAFTVALLIGTTQLSTIATQFVNAPVGLRVSLALALFAFVFVAIAENARIPIDNPATHLELTMVHEAMVLEYSGRHLAMIEAAAALKLVLYFSLLVCLFVPFGIASNDKTIPALALGATAWVAKLLVLAVLLPVGETTVAKMRVFRYPIFLGGAFAAAALAVFLLFVSRGF